MICNRPKFASLLVVLAASCALIGVSLAQDSSQDSGQPLGDVVRHQHDDPQAKKAKRVFSNEDVAGPGKHEVTGYAATTVIIPGIRITGIVPDTVPIRIPPDFKQKMVVSFLPSLDSCFDLNCAESTYLRLFSGVFGGGTAKVLFESDESISGNPARVAHMEIKNDELGKMLGTVAFVQTPASVASATCLYKLADAPDVETDCEKFIASLELHVPAKYIYVQHRYY